MRVGALRLDPEPDRQGQPEPDRGLDGRCRPGREHDEAREDGLASDGEEESFGPRWPFALEHRHDRQRGRTLFRPRYCTDNVP
jgi:hypothetical protein